MSIQAEIQSLSPSALIELFQVDLTAQGGPILYWHAGTNGLNVPLTWNGQVYTPFPAHVDGFKMSGTGALPRPTISVSNIGGAFSALAKQYNDFAGCKLIRIRTFSRFLDAVNFPGGVNPTADPTQSLPPEVWYFDRKAQEDAQTMKYELCAALDLISARIPNRQFIQNTCPWIYRGPDCGYTGTAYWDINNTPVSTQAQDVCAKTLAACQLRFPQQGNTSVPMPFGGFPGVQTGANQA